MRLASGRALLAPAILPAAIVASGCVTTQRIAARARLVDTRVRLSHEATRVVRQNPDAEVTHVELVRTATSTAVVTTLVNESSNTLTDIPISVGVRATNGRPDYLNDDTDLDFFATHVPVLRPHVPTVWLMTTTRRIPPYTRPFATVGFPAGPPAAPRALPHIEVAVLGNGPQPHRELGLSILNRSSIPQYDLPVYVVATQAGRDVAAGLGFLAHLGTHGAARLSVRLIGDPRRAVIEASANPTILN